jgi:hypothetical protein
MRVPAVTVVACLACAVVAPAEEPTRVDLYRTQPSSGVKTTPTPDLPTSPATVDDFGWLAGYWVGEAQGVTMEECWLPPSGGLVLGLHRDVLPSGKSSFEFFRIEVGEKGIAYMASPRGVPATPFWLVSSAPSKAVFQNLEHDFPQRITYWLDDGGLLHARVEGPDGEKTRVEEWFWRRAALPPNVGSVEGSD